MGATTLENGVLASSWLYRCGGRGRPTRRGIAVAKERSSRLSNLVRAPRPIVPDDSPDRMPGIVRRLRIVGGKRSKRGRNRTGHAHTVRVHQSSILRLIPMNSTMRHDESTINLSAVDRSAM
jgi:hypothetical protein